MSDARIEVRLAAPGELAEPLALLEEHLRDGEPVSPLFGEQLRDAVEKGEIEAVVARLEPGEELVGVALISFRLNVSAGATFVSIEDLYVRGDARQRGVGRSLLAAVEERCRARGVSYVEVQTDDDAVAFYTTSGFEPEPGVRLLSRSYVL